MFHLTTKSRFTIVIQINGFIVNTKAEFELKHYPLTAVSQRLFSISLKSVFLIVLDIINTFYSIIRPIYFFIYFENLRYCRFLQKTYKILNDFIWSYSWIKIINCIIFYGYYRHNTVCSLSNQHFHKNN